MRLQFLLIGSVLLLLGALSCQRALETLTPAPTPTADLRATVEAELQKRLVQVTPTPSPSYLEQVSRATLQRFDKAYREINAQWEDFHQKYETQRQQLKGCSEANRQLDLKGWVLEFQPILQRLAELETPSGAAQVGDLITKAGIEEEKGLRALRDTWLPGNPKGFQAYEDARAMAVSLRREARSKLEELIAQAKENEARGLTPTPAPSPTAVPAPGEPSARPLTPTPIPTLSVPLSSSQELIRFKGVLQSLEVQWQTFHKSYDEWRRRDGDCQQEEARKALRGFVEEFQTIKAQVFVVERPIVVRPVAERLMEAAVIEEEALKRLRDRWGPYEESHFRQFEADKGRADKLRHQVGSELDELLKQ